MRVIAGSLGGRRLVAPAGSKTRPTSDRVREALFSALGSQEGLSVLDLYAGTGALGIEALSRGAARAVFVEADRAALTALERNLGALGLEARARVLGATVERSAGQIAALAPFDLVFADPPSARLPEAGACLEALVRQGALCPEGRVALAHAARDAPPGLGGLETLRHRIYGDTAVTIYGLAREIEGGGAGAGEGDQGPGGRKTKAGIPGRRGARPAPGRDPFVDGSPSAFKIGRLRRPSAP